MKIAECDICKRRLKISKGGTVPVCHSKDMRIMGIVKPSSCEITGNNWIQNLSEKDFVKNSGDPIIPKPPISRGENMARVYNSIYMNLCLPLSERHSATMELIKEMNRQTQELWSSSGKP